jgi:recombination protein RecT
MADASKIMSLVDMVGSEQRFRAYKGAVEKTVPKDIPFDRYWAMYQQIMKGFYDDPKVTNKDSILSVMFNAAKLGLNPDPVFGQIYFVPYSGVLTYQIGYKGMLELSRRSGKVKNVRAGLVFEKDKWSYFEDETGQHYRIEPNLAEANRGKELFGYSIFTDADGMPHIHIMQSSRIDAIKKLVLARTPKSPWANDLFEPEMRKKTVIRQQWKTEAWSVEVVRAMEHEESIERGEVKRENQPELAGIVEGMVAAIEDPVQVQAVMSADTAAYASKL